MNPRDENISLSGALLYSPAISKNHPVWCFRDRGNKAAGREGFFQKVSLYYVYYFSPFGKTPRDELYYNLVLTTADAVWFTARAHTLDKKLIGKNQEETPGPLQLQRLALFFFFIQVCDTPSCGCSVREKCRSSVWWVSHCQHDKHTLQLCNTKEEPRAVVIIYSVRSIDTTEKLARLWSLPLTLYEPGADIAFIVFGKGQPNHQPLFLSLGVSPKALIFPPLLSRSCRLHRSSIFAGAEKFPCSYQNERLCLEFES